MISRSLIAIGLLVGALAGVETSAFGDDGALAGGRHRVLVSTDVGGTDPDDIQSMVHLLVYADCFDLEGLVSSPYGPGRVRHILEAIDAYEVDYPNLKSHSKRYPTPDVLRAIAVQGAAETPGHTGVAGATEGSQWIIECARRGDPRPLHVLVWGGIEDLAQALHDAPDILPKLRVYFIGGPNKKWSVDAYNYLEQNHPKLWIIEANATYRGWFVGGRQDGEWGNRGFVRTHVAGHGALGRHFVDAKDTLKMGDTPSVARLLRGVSDDPSRPGWGGRFVRVWDGRKTLFDRHTTEADSVEAFGVAEFVLPRPEGFGPGHRAQMIFGGGRPPSVGAPEGEALRFRFSPRDAKVWSYVIESDFPALDGLSGKFTAKPAPPERAGQPSERHPNWWIDDPDPAAAEGVHPGAKSVSLWREAFLRDFAARMDRCAAKARPGPGARRAADAGAAAVPAARPHRVVEPVGLSEVVWTDGFWHDRFTTCRGGMIPSMWEIMKGTRYKPFLRHFEIAAGLAEGGYHGAKWNDGDFYKWMEAVCAAQAVAFDPGWDERLDAIIEVIGKAQREDGYIHTPVLVAARNGEEGAVPFADRFNFEMYNMGHLMTTACLHHEVTGKDSLLNIARRAGDFLDGAFRSPTPEQARHAICPSHYMGILDLYRATGDGRYLKLAERLIGMRDLVDHGGDDNQDRMPLVQQGEAVGHAVRANYLYAGVADLFVETGDPELWSALERIWRNVVEKKMYITGGCGALYDGASPDGSKDQRRITRVHQAYGRNYQLPNTTAHNETCANIGNVLWNWRMFLASGEAKFIDVAELALYNSVLSGVDLGGRNYFYTNPLRQLHEAPVELRWPRTRVPFVTSFCCPPNVVRTVAEAGGYAYGRSDDTIWVNLYGSSTLSTHLGDGRAVRLAQETNYPWDGEIEITVQEPPAGGDFCLKLRIPGWANSASVSINGEAVSLEAAPGNYAGIPRRWESGDNVHLRLAMRPELIESHPLVEETRNHVAVKRGPVVYCLESNDLPTGLRLLDVRIPAETELEPRFDPGLLGGVAALEGRFVSRSAGGWEGKLYRELKRGEPVPITARLIPYYAWSNRGESEMSVWLPLE